ncbi:hypothetical protein V8C37DRAFT_364455 [Trichoderma ceciliae]
MPHRFSLFSSLLLPSLPTLVRSVPKILVARTFSLLPHSHSCIQPFGVFIPESSQRGIWGLRHVTFSHNCAETLEIAHTHF